MAINSTQITASGTPTAVFQADGQQVVTAVYFCNVGNSTVSINMFLTANSSVSASQENQVYNEVEIQGKDTYVLSTERLMLDNENQIVVEANVANAITTTVSTYKV